MEILVGQTAAPPLSLTPSATPSAPPPVVSRLAPTPSGLLHLGNAVNFVLTWLLTRCAGGTLHLRIDDLDRARLRPAYLDNVFRVIDWLGIDYDHGPAGPDDFLRHHSQLLHLPEYNAVLRRLAQRPGLLHASHRARIALPGATPAAVPLTTPGAAWYAQMPPETGIAWPETLFSAPAALVLDREMPAFVVRKKDGVPAYQVASLVDDLRLGTTLVVRGADLRPSTAAQLWLAGQLSETAAFNPTRLQFHHHPLVVDAGGRKISKTQHAAGVLGQRREEVFAAVAALLGLPAGAGESLAALRAAVAGLLG